MSHEGLSRDRTQRDVIVVGWVSCVCVCSSVVVFVAGPRGSRGSRVAAPLEGPPPRKHADQSVWNECASQAQDRTGSSTRAGRAWAAQSASGPIPG
eukprot:5131090-Pyramimonas_sp.AAC.1